MVVEPVATSSHSEPLSGVVTTSGRAKVVGVVNLTNRRNAPYWILKPDVLIDTLQALTENPHLACLSDLAKSAKERFLCATFLAVLMLGSCPAPRLGQLFQSQPPCFPWTCQRRFALLPRRLFAWCANVARSCDIQSVQGGLH